MLLNVENVSFSYNRRSQLFDGVNFNIQRGEVCGLLGKNGCGKSTLLYMMCGLMFAKTGTITYENISVASRNPEVMRDIYLLPEEFELPAMSIESYVKYNAPFYPNFSHEQFQECLRIFELPAIKKLSHYSMGQKKKFIISFALAANTPLLLMDEPTNGMDIPSKSQFRKVIVSCMSDKRSIVISTHQVHDLENVIDRVMVMHNNAMLLNENVTRIAEKLSFVYGVNKEELQDCLYMTPVPNGYAAVCRNIDGNETTVDFELLFNALIANPRSITSFFV